MLLLNNYIYIEIGGESIDKELTFVICNVNDRL